MKTYIVNLVSSIERKKHMDSVIKKCNSIEVYFFEAVDGRQMNEEERKKIFNYGKSYKKYGRILWDGEVGCTLSHYKVYQQIVNEKENFAIILEDDIEDLSNINNDLLTMLKPYYDTDIPTVILLTGNYQYCKLKKISIIYKIASVFDAYYTSGYIINNKAAEIISNEKPFWYADDWWYFKSKGVKVMGLKPHIVDPIPRDILSSIIQTGDRFSTKLNRKNMTMFNAIESFYHFGMKKIFKILGFYEPKYRNDKQDREKIK